MGWDDVLYGLAFLAVLTALILLAACVPPSNGGINTRFEAQMPIEGTIHFAQ
jgi:hypothetical protein